MSVYRGVSFILGMVLLTAAFLKGSELLRASVPHSELLFSSRWVSIGLTEIEGIFGLWLLVGLYPQTTRWLAMACFSLLGCVALQKVLAGEATCKCFGRVNVAPSFALVLDIAAVFVLWYSRVKESQNPRGGTAFRLGIFLTVAVWVGAPWAFMSGRVGIEREHAVLKPETWEGSCLPLLRNIDVGERLARGQWTVVFYHHDCSVCRKVLPDYERRARELVEQGLSPRIALIEVPPYASVTERIVSEKSSCIIGRLDSSKAWVIPTPTKLTLHDCIVSPSPSSRELLSSGLPY